LTTGLEERVQLAGITSTELSRRTFLSASGALLLAGCGSGAGAAAPSGVEYPELPIGVLPVPDVAPIYLAKRQQIFERYGLRPKIVQGTLTGDQRFDLDNGPERIHNGSWVNIFLNIVEGADWLLVGEATQTGTNTTSLVVAPGSKLRKLTDLKGAAIGVNNPRGIGVMLMNTLLATSGILPTEVKYVTTPTDKIAAAVKSGQVQAGWLFEPYLTAAELETGVEPLSDSAVGATLDLPQSGYVCSRKFAKNNPRTIDAFQAALVEAQAKAQDRSLVEREWREYLPVSENVLSLMNVGKFPSSLRAVRPQRVADLMLAQGMLKAPLDVSKLVLESKTAPPG
jgi:NitT/TauT family transport system substrate-binding protein